MVTDNELFAWLDGELTETAAVKVAEAVQRDTALRARAEQHRTLQFGLKQAFGTVTDAPVPDRLTAAVTARDNVVDFASGAGLRPNSAFRRYLPQWAALAATLAIGVFAGTFVPHRSDGPIAGDGAKLYAAAALDQALSTQLASAPSGDVRIGLTFHDRRGATCRSFTAPNGSGLACRDGGRWQLRGLFAAPEGEQASYRMAGGMDPNLAALIDSTMAGEPLDAVGERTARDRGWR